LLNVPLPESAAPDSLENLATLTNQPDAKDRVNFVGCTNSAVLSLRVGEWKWIPPGNNGYGPNKKTRSPPARRLRASCTT
jgi:hypothetical protein